MNTFLPYSDFSKSAQCLDYKRLGKQRLEARTIYNILINKSDGAWSRHPATLMWKGYEPALATYYNIILIEWKGRGFKNSMSPLLDVFDSVDTYKTTMPPWLGDERFHCTHRSNLLRKDKEWYGQFGWEETDDLPYYWPTKVDNTVSEEVLMV